MPVCTRAARRRLEAQRAPPPASVISADSTADSTADSSLPGSPTPSDHSLDLLGDNPASPRAFFRVLAVCLSVPILIICFLRLQRRHAVAPPCHVRLNPNRIAPCAQMRQIARLAVPLPSLLPSAVTGEWFPDIPEPLPLPRGVGIPERTRNRINGQTRDIYLDFSWVHLDAKYEMAGDIQSSLRSVDVVFADTNHTIFTPMSLIKHAASWQQVCNRSITATEPWYNWVQIKWSCYRNTPPSTDVLRAQLTRAILAVHSSLYTQLPKTFIDAREKFHRPREYNLHRLLAATYALLEDMAAFSDRSFARVRRHKAPQHLMPLLEFLRQVEARCLVYDVALAAFSAQMDAGPPFFRALDQYLAAQMSRLLDPHHTRSNTKPANTTLKAVARSVSKAKSLTRHDLLALAGVLDSWQVLIDRMEPRVFKPVIREVSRKWLLDKFGHCLKRQDQQLDRPSTPSALVDNSTDAQGVGCSSHPSRFMRWWFTGWDRGALLNEDVPDWPGLFDERRRPRLRNGDRAKLDTATSEVCFDLSVLLDTAHDGDGDGDGNGPRRGGRDKLFCV